MVVIRFSVRCHPDQTAALVEAFRPAVVASRALPGVIAFDVARDILDPDVIHAVEVFDDDDAVARQGALPEAAAVMAVLPGAMAAAPEAMIYRVATTENPLAAG